MLKAAGGYFIFLEKKKKHFYQNINYFLVICKPQNEETPPHYILGNVKLQFLQSVYFLQNAEYRIFSTHFTVAKKDT